jgi:hypothetical protein
MTGTQKRTATDNIDAALIDKGYRRIARHGVQRDPLTVAFTLYQGQDNAILLQEYVDGGCEVWQPLSASISIEDTVNAIPEVK